MLNMGVANGALSGLACTDAAVRIRNYRQISVPCRVLMAAGVPEKLALVFSRGLVGLNAYPSLLSSDGRVLAREANAIMGQASQGAFCPEGFLAAVEETSSKLPTVENPHLELYRKPNPEPFERAIARGQTFFMLTISKGCDSGCLMCEVDNEVIYFHMPYPMILTIAQTVSELGGWIVYNSCQIEVLRWGDKYFDADFGDLLNATQGQYHAGIDEDMLQSHGWRKGDPYAGPAAKKIFAAGVAFGRVTVHLVHKEFLIPVAPEDLLELWADRFIQAITCLEPGTIRVSGLVDDCFRKTRYEHLTQQYAKSFFDARIYPAIGLRPRRDSLRVYWVNDRIPIIKVRSRYFDMGLGKHPIPKGGVPDYAPFLKGRPSILPCYDGQDYNAHFLWHRGLLGQDQQGNPMFENVHTLCAENLY
ncbi:MAG: hypothetical protein NT099_09185 [Candidatus Saganbacteria bacterium]|nr:hypothetical protein [Candidatus Saganbacteria bacterium]